MIRCVTLLIMGHRLKVNFGTLSMKACECNTYYNLCQITSKLHIQVFQDKRRDPIDFGSQGQRWKSTFALCETLWVHCILVFIRRTCRDVLWYDKCVWASVCLSMGLYMSTKLVNTIQTEPFQLGLSNLVHILLMTRRQTLLIFKVMG